MRFCVENKITMAYGKMRKEANWKAGRLGFWYSNSIAKVGDSHRKMFR